MADSKVIVKSLIQYPYSRSVKSIGVFVGVAIALKFFSTTVWLIRIY